MNEGQYIFSQVIRFIPRYQFDKCVDKYQGDYRVHELTCYNQFLHLLFGQLTCCTSLRDICLCLSAHQKSLYHLGFRRTVDHTSLSRANERRDYRIYEEFGFYLISIVRPLYHGASISEITVDNAVYALDSTTISTSIILATWALGKYSKGAVKMHTLLDLRGNIPISIHITDGKWHDSNELDYIDPEPFAVYTFDKAYVDFEALFRFHKANAIWVSRPKDNMRYEIKEVRYDFEPDSGIGGDFRIHLQTWKSRRLYPEDIRLVRYYDAETRKYIEFITNNFDWPAIEIANLYRHRWDIEVFLKWIKQNIVVKTLWGYSENAVKTHLWVAICAYLILARIKASLRCDYSITEIATLISVSALEKAELREILACPKYPKCQIQNVKEPSLFD